MVLSSSDQDFLLNVVILAMGFTVDFHSFNLGMVTQRDPD